MKFHPDALECPECHSDWRGPQIPQDSLDKGYYGHIAPCRATQSWDDGHDPLVPCSCPVRYFNRLIGVEDGTYDGTSWWLCPDCGAKWNRWTGELVSVAP